MQMNTYLNKLKVAVTHIRNLASAPEQQSLMLGKLLANGLAQRRVSSLSEVEFKVFSQWGDDGIIQWLVNNLTFPSKTFMEFGVANYRESNTRFLMINNNWEGFVMDGSASNVAQITGAEYFWRYALTAKAAFVDVENINPLLALSGFGREIGLLHIDLDGNDYWVWKAIDSVSPVVVILEYNSVFGIDRAITVPYDKNFYRTRAHHSNLYWGASLRALHLLSAEKGFCFIGCNGAGNNAYFVRKDRLNDIVREISLEEGYVVSKFREGRSSDGKLTYLAGENRIGAIRGMPVYNVVSNQIEGL